MTKIIKIKDLVKMEKEFSKSAVFGFTILWALITYIIFNFFVPNAMYVNLMIAMSFMILPQIIISLISNAVVTVGISNLCYSIVREKGKNLSIAFQVCTNTKIFKRVGTLLLSYLIIWIGLILFIIPGIILYYAFTSVKYILIDDDYQSFNAIETLKKSYQLMKNNKMKIFLLQLRYFLGWVLAIFVILIMLFTLLTMRLHAPSENFLPGLLILMVMFVTSTILFAYIQARYQIAFAVFYQQLKEDKTSQPVEKLDI